MGKRVSLEDAKLHFRRRRPKSVLVVVKVTFASIKSRNVCLVISSITPLLDHFESFLFKKG